MKSLPIYSFSSLLLEQPVVAVEIPYCYLKPTEAKLEKPTVSSWGQLDEECRAVVVYPDAGCAFRSVTLPSLLDEYWCARKAALGLQF